MRGSETGCEFYSGLLTNLESFVLVGEVALPGGKVEEGDANDIETALREAKEEIGLDPSLVGVVTVLESFTNKVKFVALMEASILWCCLTSCHCS